MALSTNSHATKNRNAGHIPWAGPHTGASRSAPTFTRGNPRRNFSSSAICSSVNPATARSLSSNQFG